jgi:two-component system, chemotaxis family, sensor kinase CheA
MERPMREFLAEASEIVQSLQGVFASIDTDRGHHKVLPGRLNEAFRHAHSLKGLAGMFGMEELGKLSHHLESLLDGLRLGKVELSSELMAVLYACVDAFQLLLQDVVQGKKSDAVRLDALILRIQDALAPSPREAMPAKAAVGAGLHQRLDLPRDALSTLTEYEEHRLAENLRTHTPIFRVRAPLDLATFETSLAALTNAAQALGELITSLPSSDDSGRVLIFDLILASSAPLSVLEAALRPHGATEVKRADRTTVVPTAVDQKTDAVDDGFEPVARQVAETVRVDIKKLDELMGIVGELVLARGGLTRITNELKGELGFRGLAVDLHRLVRTVERRIADLQLAIMQVRMVPLGQVFDRLGHLVRRTATSVGKDVEFVVHGEETELDKLIVEDLVDPLMHLIRNAIDHGLEPPAARLAAGKPRVGTITLRAYPKGNQVVIEVGDDGRGIDEVAIKRTALERGLVAEEHIGQMTKRDIWNLIFLPGFSTRKDVTSLSGRGVGLDVVKTNIARLSGLIDVETTAGAGSRFTITLPMTLAIIQAVVIKSAGRVYALPLSSVLEMVTVSEQDLCTVESREMITLRGQTLPLLRLDRVFHPAARKHEDMDQLGYAAVVGLVQHRAALLVDDVLGQQDIVVKSLGAYLQNVRGIAGATHLGDHETILVLDVGGLMQELLENDGAVSLTLTPQPTALP